MQTACCFACRLVVFSRFRAHAMLPPSRLAYCTCAQMIMLYEMAMPPLQERWYSDVLLAVWGAMCLGVVCMYIIGMVVASIINFGILQVTVPACAARVFGAALGEAPIKGTSYA
jgi:hypothetical protein